MIWIIKKETMVQDWNDIFYGSGRHNNQTNQPSKNPAILPPNQLKLDLENNSFELKNPNYLMILKTTKGIIITKKLSNVVPNWVSLEQIGTSTVLTSKSKSGTLVKSEMRFLDNSTFDLGNINEFNNLHSNNVNDSTIFKLKSKNASHKPTFLDCWNLSIGLFVNQLRKKWNNQHYVINTFVKNNIIDSYNVELLNYNKYLSTIKMLNFNNREFLDREFLPKKMTGSRLLNLVELYDEYVKQGVLDDKLLNIGNLKILKPTPEIFKKPLNGWLSLFDLNLPIMHNMYVDFGNKMESTILEQAKWHHKSIKGVTEIKGISAEDVDYDYFSKKNGYKPKDEKFSAFVGGVPDGIIKLNDDNYVLEIKTALSSDYSDSKLSIDSKIFERSFPMKEEFKKILLGLDPNLPKSTYNRLSNYKPENILQSVLYGYLLDSKGISLDIFLTNPDYYAKSEELRKELIKQINNDFESSSKGFFNFNTAFINSIWQFKKYDEKTNKVQLTELGKLQQHLIVILKELIRLFDNGKFLISPIERLNIVGSKSPWLSQQKQKTYQYLLCQNQKDYENWILEWDESPLKWIKQESSRKVK